MIKSRRMRWAGMQHTWGGGRNVCRVLVERPEGKRPVGRFRCSWEESIKLNLRDIEWSGMEWIHPA
jgi:hypothetical protein